MTLIVDCLNEIIRDFEDDADALHDPIEGMSDLSALDVQPETLEIVRAEKGALCRRQALLKKAIHALRELLGDGYPMIPRQEVGDEVLGDIREQVHTINIAYGFFGNSSAVSLGLSANDPEPK